MRTVGCLLLVNAISSGHAYSQSNRSNLNITARYIADTNTSTHFDYLPDSKMTNGIIEDPDSLEKDTSLWHSGKLFYQGKLHGSIGAISEQCATLGFDMVNSLSLSDIVAIGVGAGLRFPLEREVIAAPLYLDFRLTLSQNRISPIIEAGWGGTFQPNTNYENAGQILLVEAGVKIEGKEKFAYMITLGYEAYDIINPKQTKSFGFGSHSGSYRTKAKKETIYSGTINFGFLF